MGSRAATVLLDASTERQLLRGVHRLATRVPPRDQGRTSDHCEQWQILHLMQALRCAGELRPPVRLSKRESPDFLLQTDAGAIGIETTEAVNPDYVRAQMHPASQAHGSVIDPSLYKWGVTGRSSRRIRHEVQRTRLTGLGWAGDSVETEFAQSVIDIVQRKHAKLRTKYARFDLDQLLVYHSQPSPCIDMDKAIARTAVRLAEYWSADGFDAVYVHKYDRMLEFTKDASRILYRF